MNLQMKSIRIKQGLKQEEAATLCGIPTRRWGSYERGERGLSLEDACQIADVLECSLDELAGRIWLGKDSTDDERLLVSCYRGATQRERSTLLEVAATFRDSGLAKNNQAKKGIA